MRVGVICVLDKDDKHYLLGRETTDLIHDSVFNLLVKGAERHRLKSEQGSGC